jgi:hypothetical protein
LPVEARFSSRGMSYVAELDIDRSSGGVATLIAHPFIVNT